MTRVAGPTVVAWACVVGMLAMGSCATGARPLVGYRWDASVPRVPDQVWRRNASSIVVRGGSAIHGGDSLIARAESLYPTRGQMTSTLRDGRGLTDETRLIWDTLPAPQWAYRSHGRILWPYALTGASLAHYVGEVRREAERFADDPRHHPERDLSDVPFRGGAPGQKLEYIAWADTISDPEHPTAAYRVELRLSLHQRGWVGRSPVLLKSREVWFTRAGDVLAISGDGPTLLIM